MKRRRSIKNVKQAGRAKQITPTVPKPVPKDAEPAEGDNRRAFLFGVGLAVVLGGVYLSTILPGVDAGDSAELQYISSLLGICHPPGYQIEVFCGKLFSMLPFGASIAWRINFMMAVAGVIGCLALYGAVRRITGQIVPGVIAAGTLGLSSIYWSHCLVAEAYVFYGMFLLLGVYAASRFIESDKALWLYLMMLFLGAGIGDRPSELAVLPAFLLLWLGVRKRVRMGIVRILLALLVFVLPFVFSVSYYLIRYDLSSVYLRDGMLRSKILGGWKTDPTLAWSPYQHVRHAVRNCLGLHYTKRAKFETKQVKWALDKYAWLLSGKGALGDRFKQGEQRQNEQGRGTSIGILGLAVALLAVVFCWRQYGWLLLGWGMFAGNLAFILWHNRWDNLTFTIPGLIGLALLVGLGSAGPSRAKNRSRLIFQLASLIVPMFLLISNYRLVDRATEEERKTLEYRHELAKAPLPANSVIITSYWPGSTFRYLYYIEAGRRDVQILHADRDKWPKLQKYCAEQGRPTFIRSNTLNARDRKRFLRFTPPEIARWGFVLMGPFPQREKVTR